MQAHLTDEQWARLASGDTAADAEAHLAQCPACASELATLRAAFDTLPAHAQQGAQQTDAFWRAQRLAISARRITAPGPHARTTWSLALAAMVLAAVLLNRPVENSLHVALQTESDHDLLVAVEQSVRRRVPEALAPAELLVAELDSAAKLHGNR